MQKSNPQDVQDAKVVKVIPREYPSYGIDTIILEKDGKQFKVYPEMSYIVAESL